MKTKMLFAFDLEAKAQRKMFSLQNICMHVDKAFDVLHVGLFLFSLSSCLFHYS